MTSDDGYITRIIRIVNPLVKREHLKQPPVVFYGGQATSPSLFVLPNDKHSQPRPWPTTGSSGQHRSNNGFAFGNCLNQSLAYTLSNNGYDVSFLFS